MMKNINKVVIVGNTGWGTTLANQFASAVDEVVILTRSLNDSNEINLMNQNKSYLPGIKLQKNITANHDWSIINQDNLLVFAVPSSSLKKTTMIINDLGVKKLNVLSATKGLDQETGLRMSEILDNHLNINNLAVISGPNLSAEINKGLPSATVVASKSIDFATSIQNSLHSELFRVYMSNDIIGVELGGALKNVIAIAAGIVDAFHYGENAKSGIVTRGLAEISKLTIAAGGNPLTLQGLSGIGDLIATSFSQYSRNRMFGELIGQGMLISQALDEINGVSEGFATLPSAIILAKKFNVDVPIFNALSLIVNDNIAPSKAIESLLSRDPRK
ncbi:MAG: NAD(P)H-dependent glycerol-3-phosphate dehydrogenase [Dehalococcoidia bacterium]|jgi:glycerol-3-phosphate dehydrogenase (NAD(P)+)